MRLRDLAMVRVRFGYPRLTVLLKREGWPVGKKLVYRLYRELGLQMRTRRRRKLASAQRAPAHPATKRNETGYGAAGEPQTGRPAGCVSSYRRRLVLITPRL